VVAVILATAQDLSIESDHETSSLGRLRTGVHEVWRRPGLRRLLFGAAAAMMFGAAVVPIEVVFAKRTLHAGDAGYGLLIGSWGVGMIVGGSLFAAAGRVRLAIVVTAGMGLIAAGYTGLAAAPDLAIACVFSALGGAGNGIWWISVVTAVQQAIPTSAQSVAMAVVEVINQLMPALGFILGGAVTALSSPRTAYALAAAGVAAVIVATSVRPIGEVEVESPLTGAG
jgi:MFS family permease